MSNEIRTITTPPDQLTVEESALILSAFSFRTLADGSLLLNVPTPVGFVRWQSHFIKPTKATGLGLSFSYNACAMFLIDNGVKFIS